MHITTAPHGYQPGGTYGCCERCGFKRRLNDLAREWTGLKVCMDTCFDPRPAELSPPLIYPEGLPRHDMSPQPPDIFITVPITGADL